MATRVKYRVPFAAGLVAMSLGLTAVVQAGVEVADARTTNELIYFGLWFAVLGPAITYLGYRTVTLSVGCKETK